MVELSPDRIMAIGGGYGPSKVLLTAVGLGLFTELGDEAMTAEAIADRLGLLKRPAIDFLDALVSLDLLARDGDGPGSHSAIHRRQRTFWTRPVPPTRAAC